MVNESWLQPISGSPIFRLKEKLKRLNPVLKSWSKLAFGNINRREGMAILVCEDVHIIIETIGANDFLLSLEHKAKSELHNVLAIKEKIWVEKSRIKYLNYSDRKKVLPSLYQDPKVEKCLAKA